MLESSTPLVGNMKVLLKSDVDACWPSPLIDLWSGATKLLLGMAPTLEFAILKGYVQPGGRREVGGPCLRS